MLFRSAVHKWGGIVFHDVINQKFAHKAIEKGADGLILVAAGAGGHAGTISPLAFVAETRHWFDGPIALSGAIANGRAIRAARILGADFAYIGSAFIATQEANAVDRYKEMITASSAEDIVYSNLFTGVHGNYLKPSIVAAGMDHVVEAASSLDAAAESALDVGRVTIATDLPIGGTLRLVKFIAYGWSSRRTSPVQSPFWLCRIRIASPASSWRWTAATWRRACQVETATGLRRTWADFCMPATQPDWTSRRKRS